MLIINNKYHSVCQLSTSVTRRILRSNMSIHLSMISWGILENGLNLGEWLLSKNRDRLYFGLGIHFPLEVPGSKNLLYSNLDYSVASDGAPVMKIVSCFSTFQGSAWPCDCMNDYSLCFASLFISGIIFFDSTLH